MRNGKQSLSRNMAVLNTQQALRYNWMCWRLLGMHPFEAKHQRLYWIYSWLLNFCCSAIYITLYFVTFFVPDDSTDSLAKLSTIFPLINSASKQAVIFYHIRHNLSKTGQHIRALDRRAEVNHDDFDCLTKEIRQCHGIFYAGAVSYFICLLLFGLLNASQHNLPFEGWMPFDWKLKIWIYLLVCAFQFFCMAVQGTSSACSDTYSVIYLKLLTAHLRVLNARIAKLGVVEEEKGIGEQEKVYIYEELVACAQDHRECIHYFNCVRPAIAHTLFVQFFSSASVLCSAAITSLQAGLDFSQVMKFLSYVVLTLFQTAPCCWYMDEIRVQLNNLTTSLYSCRWYNQNRNFRRGLIIFMQRSQKVENMLAGNIVPVSLDTFVAIVKFTFSLFTLLNKRQNVFNEE